MALAANSQIRIEVMDLRIRLERLAAAAFDEACRPVIRGRQSRAKHRLLCLLNQLPDDKRAEAHRLIRLGAHVIEESANVLHGRSGLIDLPHVVVDEWRSIVEQLEALAPPPQQYTNGQQPPGPAPDAVP